MALFIVSHLGEATYSSIIISSNNIAFRLLVRVNLVVYPVLVRHVQHLQVPSPPNTNVFFPLVIFCTLYIQLPNHLLLETYQSDELVD